MKTLNGEKIKYNLVKDFKQVKRLEKLIKKLPLEIGVKSFLPGTNIFVYESVGDCIVIRPSNGMFSKVNFGKKVNVMDLREYKDYLIKNKDKDFCLKYDFVLNSNVNLIGKYRRREYFIMDKPRYDD